MRKTHKQLASVLLLAACFLNPAHVQAEEASSLKTKYGKAHLDARYRYEFVDQDGLADNAHASTLRTRVGFETNRYADFSALIEFENISGIGAERYNDTINGKSSHPVVADIEDTELNRAVVTYTGLPFTKMKLGRQVIALDNQRFVGHVGWRQNNQTFDAFGVSNTAFDQVELSYHHIRRVNRIFGNRSPIGNFDSNSHLFRASHVGLPIGTLTAYGYLVDLENDATALSSETYGARLVKDMRLNDQWGAGITLEYAQQSEYGNNPNSYSADYFHIAPRLRYSSLTIGAGYEELGSDGGTAAFTTPLAMLHRFNGWADKFLLTPATGLRDAYIDAKLLVKNIQGPLDALNGTHIHAQYHDFSSDSGGLDYGTEWGVWLTKPLSQHYAVELKYADYHAEDFATDTQKLIFGFKFTY